ncbi:HAD-IC family P-type ATPase [bacterium]|nr:HAD-IC family P-type ATPase [bacterium]
MDVSDDPTPTTRDSGPWSRPCADLLADLGVERDQGLSGREVSRRQRRHGPNRIDQQDRTSAATILVNQFRSVIVIVLGVATVLALLLRQWAEGAAIGVVVVVNALIGFVTELRAVRAMEGLAKLSQARSRVRRDGEVREVPAARLVPGDIVVLEAGDTVTADLRVLESARLEVDESTLTGESQPVAKQVAAVAEDAPLAERTSLLFKGTAITGGSGEAVVVATGMETELGAISRDIREAEAETTPLEDRLDQLGRSFIWLTVILSVVIVMVGWWQDRDLVLVIESAVALAVAAVPEGLPIVATIALARGMRRMARQNALVNRLSAVESLGGATIIAADKTGTLTENRMTVVRLLLPDGEVSLDEDPDVAGNEAAVDALTIGALCTNAELAENDDGELDAVGDPMEAAILMAARRADLTRPQLLERRPEVREVAFDPERKLMATIHRDDGGRLAAVKGAPEAVLEICRDQREAGGEVRMSDDQRGRWREASRDLAAQGLRVIALAVGSVDDADDDPYRDLTFLGLVGLLDPPRRDVASTIETARRAGIRTVMITGDQAATAQVVADELDLGDGEPTVVSGRDLAAPDELDDETRNATLAATIFARVSPRQKLDLVDLLQQEGNIVAMTGDGVNDAPALEKADIGVAMGRRGTEVAREAADIILKDDDFSTLVTAIREGRIIFGNLRQFVLFLLSVSLSLIMAVFAASVSGLAMPVLPLQILFLNAVTHVFPALALGLGEGRPGIMDRPPRDPEMPILERRHWVFVWIHGAMIAATALAGLVIGEAVLELSTPTAQTVGFLAVALAQLWHVFNVRDRDSGVLINEITRNRYVWLALMLSLVLTFTVTAVGPVASVMRLEFPPLAGWVLAAMLSIVPVVGSWIYSLAGRAADDPEAGTPAR